MNSFFEKLLLTSRRGRGWYASFPQNTVHVLKEIEAIVRAIEKQSTLFFSLSECQGMKTDFFFQCLLFWDAYKLHGGAQQHKIVQCVCSSCKVSNQFENNSSLFLMSLFGYSFLKFTIFLIITSGPAGHMIRQSKASWQLNVELRIWLIISRFPRVSSTTRSSFFSSVYSSETGKRVYMTPQDNKVYAQERVQFTYMYVLLNSPKPESGYVNKRATVFLFFKRLHVRCNKSYM